MTSKRQKKRRKNKRKHKVKKKLKKIYDRLSADDRINLSHAILENQLEGLAVQCFTDLLGGVCKKCGGDGWFVRHHGEDPCGDCESTGFNGGKIPLHDIPQLERPGFI